MFARWINIRRGCYILTVIAIAICPWNYVTWVLVLSYRSHGHVCDAAENWKADSNETCRNPGTFITVLSGWSVFLSPMTGIVISDYFLVRHGEYHLGDMYMGNSRSAYWYTAGFNWRCFIAWLLGMAPLLRKSLLFSVQSHSLKSSHSCPYPSTR